MMQTPIQPSFPLMLRRLMLVGIFLLLWRGSVTQLVIGNVYSLTHLMLQMQAAPFVDTMDDFLANGCSFLLTAAFSISFMYKVTSPPVGREPSRQMSQSPAKPRIRMLLCRSRHQEGRASTRGKTNCDRPQN